MRRDGHTNIQTAGNKKSCGGTCRNICRTAADCRNRVFSCRLLVVAGLQGQIKYTTVTVVTLYHGSMQEMMVL